MDMVTGAQVAVTLAVPMPPERIWDLITAVERIGEWSPEATGASWCDGTHGPAPGARFTGRNRFPSGFESTVTCVVIESERPRVFAWTVLDGSGLVGSTWRYELREGGEPGTALVHHSFTHGPGASGAREPGQADPRALNGRLATLGQNMTTTIAAMTAGTTGTGETR
ncbi:SRPBCC family protein [Plantactinospora sp. CA-290183]|uniref:SRPBCC family protein n=1 Tax=Plantactinospora sp. CA-290183 TaxID=3240006 RepID=UPI003D94AC82